MEPEWKKRLKQRETEDLTTPHNCDAAYIYYPVGAELEQIDSFTTELTDIVDKMKEELVKETRILEGTDVPVYKENELSNSNPVEEQWKSDLPNGCLITDLIPTSTLVSNNLSSIAEELDWKYAEQDKQWDILHSKDMSTSSSTNSCSGKLDDSGSETDVMNESSECTVPMTSELTLGMPNEAR